MIIDHSIIIELESYFLLGMVKPQLNIIFFNFLFKLPNTIHQVLFCVIIYQQ